MEHGVEALGYHRRHLPLVPHVAGPQLGARRDGPPMPLRHAVGHRHRVAGVEEVPGHHAPDVAGAADQQRPLHAMPWAPLSSL